MSSNKGKKLHNYPQTRKPQRQRAGCRYLVVGERFGRWLLLKELERDDRTAKRAWICRCDCGVERVVLDASLKEGTSTSCGCYKAELTRARMGDTREKSPAWKGGRYLDPQGYVHIYAPDNYRFVGKKNPKPYVREHLLVMEAHLGRNMYPGETVHHRNGQPSDNRIENLELWASYHKPGQRVADLLVWAKEFLARYGDADLP